MMMPDPTAQMRVSLPRRIFRKLPDSIRDPMRRALVRLGLLAPLDFDDDGSTEPCYAGMTRGQLHRFHHELCESVRTMMEAQRHEEVLARVEAVDHYLGEENLRSDALQEARLHRVDALMALGRGHDAERALDRFDAFYGPTWPGLVRRAQLGPFTGNLDGALRAAEQALLCCPLSKAQRPGALEETALLKAGVLIQAGRHADARAFLLRLWPGGGQSPAYNDRQLGVLRKTIDNASALQEFKDSLGGDFCYRGRRSLNALFHYSIAARDLGQYDEALLAIERRFVSGVQLLQFGGKPATSKVNWTQRARRALLDLRHDLDAAGIDFFLISGTLLGCIREQDILGHDKDIDIGIMEDVGAGRIRAALQGTGRFVQLPEVTPRILRVKHSNGVMIDVFLHWEEDGRLYHEGQKTRWWNTPFRLVEQPFLGASFLVPHDPDLYLRENYGDWRTPAKDFETFCDTPNMIPAHREELLWYYLRVLLDHYFAGSAARFARVWDRIESMCTPSAELRKAVDSARAGMRDGQGPGYGGDAP